MRFLFILCLALWGKPLQAQTNVNIFLDSIESSVGTKFTPGVFYVPKTTEAQSDFLNNGIQQTAIRLNVTEGALNNSSNLTECIQYLDNSSTTLQSLSNKTANLIFVFGKMPPWLSSSNDGSPSATPGWYVLNTKPPADYTQWNNVVVAIVDRIVNTYGISNAQFEIWNEPDLGAWTGTQAEYFELFQKTYDAIKSVNINLPVGGPATNHWGKNINYQPPFGHLSNAYGDSSLIGELLDSTTVWNKPLDFISWHNFHIAHQTDQNAIDYITQKCAALGVSVPVLMVNEWNTPSLLRETPLQKSYFTKYQMEAAKTSLDYHLVAAWQDFTQDTDEFHSDYGLLTWGSIHKPAYKVMLLAEKIRGDLIKITGDPADVVASISNDTLRVLLVNYVPPAFVEALQHTLFEGGFNTAQLDSAGFIDLVGNDISVLTSIYEGQTTIANSNPMHIAINNSIPLYTQLDSLQTNERLFQFEVNALNGNHSGTVFTLDSTINNSHFHYDSLILAGFTQANAITTITSDQNFIGEAISMNNGQFSTQLQPNSIQLFEFVIPELLSVNEYTSIDNLRIYPNPTKDQLSIKNSSEIGEVILLNIAGQKLGGYQFNDTNASISLHQFPKGIYFLHFSEQQKTVKVSVQ